MNLSKIIKREDGDKELTADSLKSLKVRLNDISVLSRYDDKLAQRQRDLLVQEAWPLIEKGHAVPKLHNVLDFPKSTTVHARKLADRIGFLIMPYAYLHDNFAPGYSERQEIELLGKYFDLYVMAPICAYSLDRHIKSEEDLPIHVPQDASQAFMALSMSVPVFRSMQRQLSDMRDHIRDYHDKINNLSKDVKALKNRVNELTDQVIEARAERAQTKEREKATETLSNWMYKNPDPLVLGLGSTKTIHDKCLVMVGPAWGELPASVIELLDLKSMD